MSFKMLSAIWQPFGLSLSVLIHFLMTPCNQRVNILFSVESFSQVLTKITVKCTLNSILTTRVVRVHLDYLTHWGRVTHICVNKLTIIASDNGLSPGRRQAIIWTSAGILLIGPLGTNFSEILIEIITFSFKKMRLKVSSAKWRPCCLGLNVLTHWTEG